MTAARIERRLAAILSADVAGYSRLMAEDEPTTIRTLTSYRHEISGLVRDHRGRVVDFTGDNFLAEFPSAIDAVECALEIQRVVGARNADLPDARRMEFRIGVHLGDVTIEDERLYGDGVNIAARLERLAEAGGVRISGEVHRQVERKLDLGFEDLGDQEVKNIPKPIRVYRVHPERREADRPPAARLRRSVVGAVAALVLLAAVAFVAWKLVSVTSPEGPAGEQPPVSGFGTAPAIAVLPFDNLSGDPEQEYFADGIAEDLITRLSEWRSFPVIARNSSFTYKGQAVDVKRVGTELDVRYVVEGSVRRANDRVRIAVQLIDATTGHHLWAETYDREFRDIFAVQDEITEKVVASIVPELEWVEVERAVRKEARNLDAYDYRLRGMWHVYRWTPEDNRRARALFEKSLEADPQYALAWMRLGGTHLNDAIWEWSESREVSIRELERAARSCIAIDDQLAPCQIALVWSHMLREEVDKAIAAAEQAVRLNPNDLGTHGWLGMMLTARNRPEEAIPELEMALRLSPRDPDRALWLVTLAWAHFAAGRYERAAEWAQRTLQHHPDDPWAYAALATSYGQLGRIEEAHAALEEALAIQPDLTLGKVVRRNPGTDPELLERWLDGLRTAGLEE